MNLLAAFIFFTRLPFWRLKEVPSECFKHGVPYWPWVGWLTGSAMAMVLALGSLVMPVSLAWIWAIVTRLLITGALHEDGLADFFDGFGGGTTRERTLAIMKDSHIGTYGVIGLIVYFLLMLELRHLPVSVLCTLVVCGDCWGKLCASQLINFLPYARKEEDSKAKVIYNRMSSKELFFCIIGGTLPLWLFPLSLWGALVAPCLILAFLILLMNRRLQGYTGDCCGATFLMCEMAFYLSALILI